MKKFISAFVVCLFVAPLAFAAMHIQGTSQTSASAASTANAKTAFAMTSAVPATRAATARVTQVAAQLVHVARPEVAV